MEQKILEYLLDEIKKYLDGDTSILDDMDTSDSNDYIIDYLIKDVKSKQN